MVKSLHLILNNWHKSIYHSAFFVNNTILYYKKFITLTLYNCHKSLRSLSLGISPRNLDVRLLALSGRKWKSFNFTNLFSVLPFLRLTYSYQSFRRNFHSTNQGISLIGLLHHMNDSINFIKNMISSILISLSIKSVKDNSFWIRCSNSNTLRR